MATLTFNRTYKQRLVNNHINKIIYNGTEYDITGSSDTSITTSDTVQTMTFVCVDGYSFNPNNATTPTISTDDFIYVYLSTTANAYYMSRSDYIITYNDDYSEITIDFSNCANAVWMFSYNAQLRYSSNGLVPTVASTNYTVTATTENVTAGTDNPATVNENESFTLTYTANDGYYISNATCNIGTVTISDDKLSVTITGTATENIIVTVTGTVITYSLTENLTNVTADSSNTSFPITSGTAYALRYNANAGYIISSATSNAGDMYISSDKSYASINGTATADITINVTAQSEIVTYTVTATTENVTAGTDNPATVNENESFTLTYTANDGYYISNATCNIGTVTISDDKLSVTITGTATENIIVSVTGTVNNFTYSLGTLTNCTCNKSAGETVNINDTITITANDGYYFSGTAYTYIDGTITRTFTKSSDTVLTATITALNNITINDITATLIPVSTTSAFLHIYSPSNSDLNDLSKVRFYELGDSSYSDYGENILQLYRCYIPIPEDTKSTDNIILGKMTTTINTTAINNNIIEITTEITTDGLYYDSNYTATLYIPNLNRGVNIDVSHIFNKTLTIKLSYDLYTNKCQYSLYDNNVMFDCDIFTFGSNIPFRFYEYNTTEDYNYNPPLHNYCVLVIDGENIITISESITEYINGDLLEIDTTDINENDYNELIQILHDGVYT